MNIEIVKKVESKEENEDKTIKYLLKTVDNNIFEAVVIFENTLTLCTSSQIGCPVRCIFCRTGKDRFLRNLTSDEIVSQVEIIEKDIGRRIECVSYMGMGEPLLNLDNVIQSMIRLNKKYKLSTMVIPGKLLKLAEIKLPLEVYISLHASSEKIRNQLIPLANSYNFNKIIEEINEFSEKTGNINVWYLLLRGVNDGKEDSRRLVQILNQLKRVKKVYLKEYCETGMGFEKSLLENVGYFQKSLEKAGIPHHYSVSEGQSINGGCGQLRWQFITEG